VGPFEITSLSRLCLGEISCSVTKKAKKKKREKPELPRGGKTNRTFARLCVGDRRQIHRKKLCTWKKRRRKKEHVGSKNGQMVKGAGRDDLFKNRGGNTKIRVFLGDEKKREGRRKKKGAPEVAVSSRENLQ